MPRYSEERRAAVVAKLLLPPQSGSVAVSDGLSCFAAVEQAHCQHVRIITGGGPNSVTLDAFTWVNTMLGNVKNSLHRSYHAVSPRHLPHAISPSSAIASIVVSGSKRRCRASAMSPCASHRCRSECSV